MGDLEDLIRSRLALSVFVQGIFNDVKLLDARDWKIYAGIGKYFNTPQVPFGVTDTARAARLGIVARYGAALQPNVVARSNSKGEIDSFDFPRSLDEATRVRPQIHPLFFIMRRADLVWDDADELIRSEFPYPAVASNLTLSVRAQVYGGSLTQIKPPADDSNSGFFDTGEQFYATAAAQATYATALDGQPYYPKWKMAKPTAKDRFFAFDQLSDVYLQQNFQAYDLEKGAVHLFLQIEQTNLVTKLYQDNQGRFRDEAIVGTHLPMVGNYFTALADQIKALKAKNSKVQGVAWFVYTLEGTDHAPTFTGLNTVVTATLTMNVREQVVDPQVIVMSAGKLSLEHLDPVQKAFGRRDWLKEMVRLRFSEPWVWFWKNAGVQMFYQIDRDVLFLNDLREQERSAAAGPLKQTLGKFIKSAVDHPELYLIRRGYKYGADKRVIGSDESYVYFYNSKDRLVTRLPMFAFWRDVNVSQISKVIYENTRGMVPVSKAIVWAGVAVMGWAIVGTEVLVEGFKNYVREKIEGIAFDALLKRTWDKIKLRLLVMLIFPILELFRLAPSSDEDPNNGTTGGSSGAKIYAFIKGFAEGFSSHALHSLMDRWTSFFNLEPASYRAIKLMMKIEAILRWVDEKMSALKEFVTTEVAKLLLNRFVKVTVDIGSGLITVVNTLYFLDYDKAKPMLEMYSELAGERVPDQAQWNRIRHRHFVEAFHHWERVIKDEAKDVKEIYDDVQTYIRVSIWVVRGVWVAVIADVLTAGGLVPLMIMALRGIANGAVAIGKSKVGTAGAAGLVTMTILDDDFRKEVLEFLRDHGSFISAPAGFAWGSAPRMARFGQLLGIIVASVAISKGIVKEAKWKDRWAPGIGKAYKIIPKHLLVSQLQVNPLLPAIKLALFHYVQLVEQVILDSRQSFAELEQKIEDILLGDPKYRDIIEPDEGLTLPKLLEIVQVVEKMVADWLKRLAQVPGLSDRIGEIAERLEHLAPDRMPTIEDIRDGKMEETEWLREAFMFIILSHLHGGLNYVSRALHEMVQPVNPKASTPVSVSLLLQTLGFNLQDAEAQELLDRNFDQVFEEQAT